MWKQKIGISLGARYDCPMDEALRLVKQVGFDAVSPVWDGNLETTVATAREHGLYVQSVHAPFDRAAAMWGEDEAAADAAVAELLRVLADCHRLHIPVMVAHVWIGFDYTFGDTTRGLDRWDTVVRTATEYGVKIALENTEGEEYLFALAEHFADNATVGFCWDSGHEMCYNHSQDMLAKYGKYVCATHLNDNLGIKDYTGIARPADDLHLLPMDGVADWTVLTERLAATGFNGPLTFELKRHARPGRHETDRYMRIPLEEYLANCYISACRVGALFEKARKMQKNA